ncbi:hypothetical protein AB0M50_00085 [Nonomuraea fuscirosea]|uniref:hypothetical protein n=1 Tax=Nonomuraea fuscirosea TaxID=1291556 RepID=UPI0034473E22
MSTVIQASTEIDLEDAAVARKKPESSTDRELVSVAFLGYRRWSKRGVADAWPAYRAAHPSVSSSA